MARIIMKWGGGLISDKSSVCTPNQQNIRNLAQCVKQIAKLGHDIIIVHGAGSFGHIRARQYRLDEGNIDGLEQKEGVDQVRADMLQLHDLVVESLLPLNVISHKPREFVQNNGPDFQANLEPFLNSGIHVTFGDVVECDPPREFGILSGDDLMLRLSCELPDVTHSIFAMGGTPGLMTSADETGTLIPIWNWGMQYSGEHNQEIDVTGGIFLKAQRAAHICEDVDHVWFVDGEHASRILEIVECGESVGTRIVPSQ